MPVRRLMQLLTAAVAAVLVLSGCSGGSAPSVVVGEAKRGGSVTVAEVNAFSSFNPYSANGNTDINTKIGAITHSGFFFLDDSSKVVRNDKFGHYEKVSDQPLKVKYTVNEGVKWSDGAPVDAADLLLSWAAGSGYFDDVDPGTGKGTKYFATASNATGLAGTVFPELGSDGRSITIEYAAPYADWEVAFDVGLPAHVVAAKSGLTDEEDLVNLLKDTPRGNPEKPASIPALKKVSDFWNTGFDTKTIPDDPALYLSSGPYIVRDIVPEVSMKLVRNRDYTWGQEPWLDEINVRFTGAVPAAVDALRNGQADIISPQPSAATDALFAGLAGQGITVQRYKQAGYDHLDLNFTGPFTDKDLREAFLKTVPRQEIVDAGRAGRRWTINRWIRRSSCRDQPKYADTVKNNGSSDYAKVDIDAAKSLLKGPPPQSGSCTTGTTPTAPRPSP